MSGRKRSRLSLSKSRKHSRGEYNLIPIDSKPPPPPPFSPSQLQCTEDPSFLWEDATFILEEGKDLVPLDVGEIDGFFSQILEDPFFGPPAPSSPESSILLSLPPLHPDSEDEFEGHPSQTVLIKGSSPSPAENKNSPLMIPLPAHPKIMHFMRKSSSDTLKKIKKIKKFLELVQKSKLEELIESITELESIQKEVIEIYK